MLRITSLSVLAKLLGREVLWLGMGFGPFYRRPTRWVTRLGLKFCDRVTVRDAESQREIAQWISPDKLILAFDLAALLMRDPRQRILPVNPEGRAGSTLGICVTSVRQCLTSGPHVEAVFWRRLAVVLNRAMNDRPGMRIRVMVFRGGNWEDDWALSQELYDTLAAAHPERAELVRFSPEPRETLRKVAECDAFVATRYHSGVLAYLAGCRLLFFAYHRKVLDLAREIGLPDAACITPSEDFPEADLDDRICRLLDGDDVYRARLPLADAMRRAELNLQPLRTSC
jgi:polysaccharide pyruvyl transferase WcaK-like protein